jgi:hypothetical protein
MPNLEELLRHTSRNGGCTLWIEPATNAATHSGGLLPWVSKMVLGAWKRVFRPKFEVGESLKHFESAARYERVLHPEQKPRVNLAVVRCEFAGRDDS